MPPSPYATRTAGVMLLAVALGACTSMPRRQERSTEGLVSVSQWARPANIDHVILAIDSLDRGIALLREATGVTARFGGAHPGRGTQNALIALGPGVYLELAAPNPRDSAGPAQVAEFAGFRELTPVGWAVRTTDADSLHAFLVSRGLVGGAVRAGSRQRPDGTTLRWRTLDPWGGASELLPFFIEWDPAGTHPSVDAPAGCTLVGIALAAPRPDSLRTLLERAEIHVPVAAAPREAMSLTLDCPKGRIQFPPRVP
jgi:glyoxalase-like protein